MIVFSNQKTAKLAGEVADSLGAEMGEIEKKTFPDGEIYIRLLTTVSGKETAVISTTQNNDDVVELILMLSAFKSNGAKNITCVMPHMAYQRQDSAFKEGEAVSAEVFLKIIDSFADKIITINAHFLEEAGDYEFGGVKITNLDAFPLLGKYFEGTDSLAIVSPDEGSKDYAKAAADAACADYDHLIKKRIDGETVEMKAKDIDVNGKNVVILDDIIATGGTMIKAAEKLKEQGASSVSLGCVHGVFTKGTDIFEDTKLVCTNSIQRDVSKVSLAPIIAKALNF